MVRVFDPRPPWWRIAFIYAVFVASILLYFKYEEDLKQHRAISGHLNFYSHSDQPPMPGVVREVVAQWPVRIASMEFTESVSLGVPTVTIDGTRFTGDIDQLFASNEPHIVDVLNQFRALDLEGSYRRNNWHPDWHVDKLIHIQQNSYYGNASRTLWHRAVLWYAMRIGIVIPLVYIAGMFYVRSGIARKHRRVLGGHCPSCRYSLQGVLVSRCPECGIDVLREARLLLRLHTKGYRGLKQFMREESTRA